MMELSARDLPGGQLLQRLQKEQLKNILFPNFPFIFKHISAYHNWVEAAAFRNGCMQSGAQAWFRRQFLGREALDFSRVEPEVGKPIDRVAVVVHAFYPEVFEGLIAKIADASLPGLHLYITCPPHARSNIQRAMQQHRLTGDITEVDNRGRDILPFLQVLPKVLEQDFPLVLKLHTKRENHRNTRQLWQDGLFDALLQPARVPSHLAVFRHYTTLGMLVPAHNLLPMSMYYGANAGRVLQACKRLGMDPLLIPRLHFPAGSMFYARPEALQPLLSLGWGATDFEVEAAQFDGTLAHVLERMLGASVLHSGMVLADTNSTLEGLKGSIYFKHAHIY